MLWCIGCEWGGKRKEEVCVECVDGCCRLSAVVEGEKASFNLRELAVRW